MAKPRDLFISAPDVQELCAMLVDWPRRHPMEVEAAIELTSTLDAARVVPAARLPANVVKMGSTVTYADDSSGSRRTVTVVHPAQADAGAGRVSVLSPIGRTLLGRRAGSDAEIRSPTGRRLSFRIERVVHALQYAEAHDFA